MHILLHLPSRLGPDASLTVKIYSVFHFLQLMKGKEIIEYYLRELEKEGVTYIPRWTSTVDSGTVTWRHQLLPPSAARAIPVNSAKDGLHCKDSSCSAELVTGSPDGQCVLANPSKGLI